MAAPPVDDARLRRRRRRTWPRSRPSACRGPRAAPRAAPGPRPGRAASRRAVREAAAQQRVAQAASSESKLPEAARTQASAAPKPWGEGGGARGFVREPKDDAGDGVAIGGAGGGCDSGASPWPFLTCFRETGSRPIQPTSGARRRAQ